MLTKELVYLKVKKSCLQEYGKKWVAIKEKTCRQEIFSEFNNRVGLNKRVGRISPQN